MKKLIIATLTIATIFIISKLYNKNIQVDFSIKQQNNLKKQASSSLQHIKQFNEWKTKHNRVYKNSQQQKYRFAIFIKNLQQIEFHNKQSQSQESTYTLGINQFTDLTHQQFLETLGTFTRIQNSLKATKSCVGTIITSPNPPQEVDWTGKFPIAMVNQANCGGSYAISTVSALEGLRAKNQKNDKLSVQQVLDCSGSYGNQGCQGGFMDQSFWYIIDNGITFSKSYLDEQKDWQKSPVPPHRCTYTTSMRKVSITRCADVPSLSYIKLLSAVIQQPTTIAMDISPLQHYKSGIYNGQCSQSNINQAMVIVGYGVENNQTYWKMQNSFGVTWGQNGYLRLERLEEDGPGKCGVQLVGSVPQGVS